MWILFHSQGKSFCLLPGKEYVIGRKNVDLVLEGDFSVSRKHAVLSVTSNTKLDVRTPPSTLKLLDEKSMHGTYIKINDNWHELTRNEERVLADTDTIRFGKQDNEWRVMYIPLVVTTSKLETADKQQLRSSLENIDGYLTNAWGDNLTHLTMKSITLTIKAICALASGKPIVTPEYWSQYLEMATNNKELPDCDKFIPPVVEPTIDANTVSLAVNDERRSVFRGKHFVFASRIDLGELGCMITSAGGTAAAFDDYIDSFDRLCLPDVILISCSFITSRSGPTQQVQLVEPFNNAIRYLEKRGRRVITDKEIGYAILYCSTEKYCNPQYALPKSSGSNASQIQSSRPSLDFSSQAVNRPTEEMESVPQSLQPFKKPTNKQPVVQRSGHQHSNVHSDEATFDHSSTQASCASSRDIFASPIKVERASERETYEACDNRKRIRTPELGAEPEPKRPANVTNAPSRSAPIKLETEDLFSFATDNPGHKRTRPRPVSDSDGEDDFTFSNEPKPKRDNPACLNESSRDLFASAPNSPMDVSYAQQQKAVEACGSSTVREALGRKAVPTVYRPEQQAVQACESNAARGGRERKAVPALCSPDPPVVQQKRKKPSHDWDNDPPLKKSAPSIDTTAQTTSTVAKAPMSLRGFLNTTHWKPDEHEMDQLANSVTCIFLIETKDLVVRRPSSSLNETKNVLDSSTVKNFKRFKKVWPINHRILPRIIGGKDLQMYRAGADNNWDVTVDDTRENEKLEKKKERDEWDFPTPGKSVNKSRINKINK